MLLIGRLRTDHEAPAPPCRRCRHLRWPSLSTLGHGRVMDRTRSDTTTTRDGSYQIGHNHWQPRNDTSNNRPNTIGRDSSRTSTGIQCNTVRCSNAEPILRAVVVQAPSVVTQFDLGTRTCDRLYPAGYNHRQPQNDTSLNRPNTTQKDSSRTFNRM